MPRATAAMNGQPIELEFVTFGADDGAPLLLINGFNGQLTGWSPSLVDALVTAGFRVIAFDNRDSGLSSKFDGVTVDVRGALRAARAGTAGPPVPYTLSDMAADAIAVLDAAGVATAHVLGVSMGGMIAQTVAIEHASRVRSLISVMSFTGEWEYGAPTPDASRVLLAPPLAERQAFIDASVLTQVWQSKRWFDAEATRARAAEAFDRSFYPAGGPRQLAAIYASGSRAEALRSLRVPTLVIHGRDDTLIPPSGGMRTAELVPTATLLLLADMGHDLPVQLEPIVIAAITEHATLADGA
jgi:pimeloyl-ACP methyl ester carboxylesterase